MKVTFNTYNRNIRFASQIQMSDEAFHAKEKSILPLIDKRFGQLNCHCKHDKATSAKINLNKTNILLAEKLLKDDAFPINAIGSIIKSTNRRAWNGTLDSFNSEIVKNLETLYKKGGHQYAFAMWLLAEEPEKVIPQLKKGILTPANKLKALSLSFKAKLLGLFKRIK